LGVSILNHRKSAFIRAADLAQQGRKILDAPKCACGFPALFRVVISTSKRRFPLVGKKINYGLAFDFALLASLSEGGVGRLFLAADGRSVALYGAVPAPYRARGRSRGRTEGQLSLSLGEKIAEPAPSQRAPKTCAKP